MKRITDALKKLLADAKTAGKEVTEADLTAVLALTAEDVAPFLESEEGKKILLPRIDQAVTKGIDSFKKNNLDKLVEERYNAAHPPETPEQKRMRELEENLSKEKNERLRSELKSKLVTEATKKGLPVDLLDHFIGADEETSLKNLGNYETVFTTKLNESVEKRLAAGGRAPNSGTGGTPPKTFTRDQMKDPNFVNANWVDIQAAMAAGTITD